MSTGSLFNINKTNRLLHQIVAKKIITFSTEKKKNIQMNKNEGQKSSHSVMYTQVDGEISPPSWQSSNTWKNVRRKKKKSLPQQSFENMFKSETNF